MVSIPPSHISPDDPSPGPRAPGLWKGLLPLGAGIIVVVVVPWAYVVYMVWGMANMDVAVNWLLMPRMSNWGIADIALVFVMWAVMMAAMMLPSAVPLLSLLARIYLQRHRRRRALLATGVAGFGYLTAWTGFSVLATLAQWGLLEARLVSPMMESSSPYLSGALLAAAGAYQFTALKYACLSRCRSPLSALMTHGGASMPGAFLLGLRQGAYCTGCCWLLMVLMFVLGVMNLLWIAGLTLLVLLEKILRQPRWFVQLIGVALLVWAGLVISHPMFR